MSIAITVVVVIVVLGMVMNSLSKSGQKLRGRNRCEKCKSRLKAVNGKYATTCAKCGAEQSWA